MAQFPALELTAKGQDMIIRSSSGKEEDRLIITRAKLGDGILNKDIRTLEDIISTKLVVPLSQIKVINKQAQATFVYDNKNLTEGFYHREVGVFAKNGSNGTEFLLSYSNAGSYTSYIPSQKTPIPSQTMNIVIGVSNSDNVELHIVDEGVVTPKQLEELKAFIEGLINSHKNKEELDHPEKSVKEKHLANDSVGHMQLQADSVFGSAIKNGSITPEKLSQAYFPTTGGTVKGHVHATDSISTNGSIYLDVSKIDSANDTSVINIGWLKENSVNSFDGKKGDVDLIDALYKINNETPMTGKTMEEYFQNKGIVKNYYNPESCKTENLPFPGCAKLSFPFYRVDHSYVELAYGQQGTAWRVWIKGRRHEDAPWTIYLDKNNFNDVISLRDFDLRNKTGYQLSQYGFCKFHVGEGGQSLGYPGNWTIVLNIPHGLKNGGDTRQMAMGAFGDIWYRSVNGSNTTDNTPWIKYASTDYVDKVIKNATKLEILDFE